MINVWYEDEEFNYTIYYDRINLVGALINDPSTLQSVQKNLWLIFNKSTSHRGYQKWAKDNSRVSLVKFRLFLSNEHKISQLPDFILFFQSCGVCLNLIETFADSHIFNYHKSLLKSIKVSLDTYSSQQR